MLKVLKTGFFTTVQDTGRFGYRDKGVPVCGVMDRHSGVIANALLENDEKAAVLEITMTGPVLQFDEPTYIAICGAEMSPSLNDHPIPNNEVHKVRAGDTLSFGKLSSGFRSYLSIKNGFQTAVTLGSRSFYKPITPENRIKAGMELSYGPVSDFDPKITTIKPALFHKQFYLEVQRGPEYELLSEEQRLNLFSQEFTIAKENNRMAYQLEENLLGHSHTMLTSATIPGTVQMTPAGRLIVLMRNGQTTGGYPRILQLSPNSISVLSQKKFGDKVAFQLY